MDAVFLKLLNMSITAGWLVLAVIILRLLLKKAPKWITGILWVFVAIRLICPFSLESIFSLIPSAEPIPQNLTGTGMPSANSSLPLLNPTVGPDFSGGLSQREGNVAPIQLFASIASIAWITGVLVMLLYTLVSFLRLHRKVREAVPLRENLWICDRISAPFILGIFRPRIYMPSSVAETDRGYVLSHEKAHLRRKDHIWKPLGFLLLTVYWFNPLLWVAYILLCKDIELACDEKVIRELGAEIKKPYSDALINCSVPRRTIAACPLAFGEVGVKARVKSVLHYKKPSFWIILAAVAACTVTAVCLLTDPKKKDEKTYTDWVDFIIGDATTETQYRADSWIYDCGSGITDLEHLSFCISGDMGLTYNDAVTPDWHGIGQLVEYELTKENFDDLLAISPIWADGYSAAKIRRENRKAYCAGTGNVPGRVHYVLYQENGDVYMACGDGEGPCIQWIYKMEPRDSSFNAVQSVPTHRFEATVLAINKKTVLVCPDGNADESKSADKIYVSLDVISTNILPEMKVGDRVSIGYYGSIGESDPAQINWTSEIWNLDEFDSTFATTGGGSYGPFYRYQGASELLWATLALHRDNIFSFLWRRLGDYVATGTYVLTDATLTLTTDDGKYQFIFDVADGTFLFNESKSSRLPRYRFKDSDGEPVPPVPDKAVFVPEF